jgi:hypothetical protein
MVLVAALAAGISVVRAPLLGVFAPSRNLWKPGVSLKPRLVELFFTAQDWAAAPLFCTSCAILVMRIREPRPPIRFLVRRGDFAALLAIVVASLSTLLMTAIQQSPTALGLAQFPYPLFFYQWFNLLDMVVGPAVLAAWLNCAAGGRWGIGRDWLGWSSAAVEILWVILFVCWRCVLPVLLGLS